MNFFSAKNKKEQKNNDLKIEEELEKEIIVHNMPSQQKISGEILNPVSAGSVSLDGGEKKGPKDFKLMGVLIIFLGVLVIALIVFLTYRYVISPTVKSPEQVNNNQEQKEELKEVEQKDETSLETEILSDGSEILVKEEEPIVETEDSQGEIMQEEFGGKDVSDLPPLIDSDDDGLYDEEEIILGTSISLRDSDADGYSDYEEIMNGYNPLGSGLLIDAPTITEYRDDKNSFSFLYPSSWEAKKINDNLITIEIDDGSLIQLVLMENYDNLSILNWYQENFSEEGVVYDKLIYKPNYEGVISESRLNVYLSDQSKKKIFVFSYIPAAPERLSLINIFKMIYSSFELF